MQVFSAIFQHYKLTKAWKTPFILEDISLTTDKLSFNSLFISIFLDSLSYFFRLPIFIQNTKNSNKRQVIKHDMPFLEGVIFVTE